MGEMWRLTRPDAAAIMEDPKVRRSLPRYVDVVKNKKPAKFVVARSMEVDYAQEASSDELWRVHGEALREYSILEKEIDGEKAPVRVRDGRKSFLDLKVELARRIMGGCVFCVRRCGVDRLSGERGYCRGGLEFSVSSTFPHLGEEPELVPSGTVSHPGPCSHAAAPSRASTARTGGSASGGSTGHRWDRTGWRISWSR
jgi:putative pyruvate formate lyase activating enzyme